MCELVEGRGRLLLSQLLVGEKLGREPMAGVMLENMLRYASRRPQPGRPAFVVQDKLPLRRALDDVGVLVKDVSGALAGADLGACAVLVAEADCAEVRANLSRVRQFAASGGQVVLHGATPEGLAAIADLLPERVVAQCNSSVPVSIAQWDPMVDGLCNQDLYWYGSRKGLEWRVRTPLAPGVCSNMIGTGLPRDACMTVEAETMEAVEGKPRVEEDHVYMGARATLSKRVRFAKTGEYSIGVRGKGTPVAGTYPVIRVSLDGKSVGSVAAHGEKWATYTVAARVEAGEHELALAFVNDAWAPEKGEDRNVWLDKVVYGPVPGMKAKRLLSPAALVEFRLGKGRLLLDQVNWHDGAVGGEHASRYVSALLRNLGCAFRPKGRALVVAADRMQAEPNAKLSRLRGGEMYMGSNGTIFASVRFAKSRTYRFALRASGTEAGGEFPNVDLTIDGKKVGSLTLERSGWHVLRLEAHVPAGEHKVGLSFTNDFYDPPADRNLIVDRLEIE